MTLCLPSSYSVHITVAVIWSTEKVSAVKRLLNKSQGQGVFYLFHSM